MTTKEQRNTLREDCLFLAQLHRSYVDEWTERELAVYEAVLALLAESDELELGLAAAHKAIAQGHGLCNGHHCHWCEAAHPYHHEPECPVIPALGEEWTAYWAQRSAGMPS